MTQENEILLSSSEQVVTPVLPGINVRGVFVPEALPGSGVATLEPGQVLVPKTKPFEVLTLGAVTNQEHRDRAKEPKVNNEYLHFLSSPWDYFDLRLRKHDVPSPILEIKEQIEESRRELPTLPADSKILLKSPLKSIRDQERQRLISSGISSQVLDTLFLPDISFVNASELGFIQQEKISSFEGFYDFLNQCINELLAEFSPSQENMILLASLFQYLDVFCRIYLYSSGQSKLDSPQLLDNIAKHVECLQSKLLEIGSVESLRFLFDFLSHFKQESRTASRIFLSILEEAHISHPIKYEFLYQLDGSDVIDSTMPKVGLEIEGVPLVSFGKFPEGFSMGLDGGGGMPEIRRNKEALHFDGLYRKQLFDFWYWASMAKLKGASVHITLDNNSGSLLSYFQSMMGSDYDDLRRNRHGGSELVELRFNLSGYNKSTDFFDKDTLKLSDGFDFNSYDLATFIEALLSYGGSAGGAGSELGLAMPIFWQETLKKKVEKYRVYNISDFTSLISFLGMSDRQATSHSSEIRDQIKGLSSIITFTFSFEQVVLLLERFSKHPHLALIEGTLHEKCEEITKEELFLLGSKCRWSSSMHSLSLLEGQVVTFEEYKKIIESVGWQNSPLIESATRNLGRINCDEFMTVLALSRTADSNVELVFEKIDEPFTEDDLKIFGNIFFADPKLLDLEQMGCFIYKSKTAQELRHCIELVGWRNIPLVCNLISGFSGKLEANEFAELVSQVPRFKKEVIKRLAKKIDQNFDYQQFITVGALVEWDFRIMSVLVMDSELVFNQSELHDFLQSGQALCANFKAWANLLCLMCTKSKESMGFDDIVVFANGVAWEASNLSFLIELMRGRELSSGNLLQLGYITRLLSLTGNFGGLIQVKLLIEQSKLQLEFEELFFLLEEFKSDLAFFCLILIEKSEDELVFTVDQAEALCDFASAQANKDNHNFNIIFEPVGSGIDFSRFVSLLKLSTKKSFVENLCLALEEKLSFKNLSAAILKIPRFERVNFLEVLCKNKKIEMSLIGFIIFSKNSISNELFLYSELVLLISIFLEENEKLSVDQFLRAAAAAGWDEQIFSILIQYLDFNSLTFGDTRSLLYGSPQHLRYALWAQLTTLPLTQTITLGQIVSSGVSL